MTARSCARAAFIITVLGGVARRLYLGVAPQVEAIIESPHAESGTLPPPVMIVAVSAVH